MDKYLIYGLYCPFTDCLHYIGKSTVGMVRPLQHMSLSHSSKINEWVSELAFLGHSPVIKIMEVCNEFNIDERELAWIEKSKLDGCYLLNVAHNATSGILLKKEYLSDNRNIKIIGAAIKRERLLLNISAEELALISGVSRPTLCSIENGSGSANISSINAVLQSLGLSINITKGKVSKDDGEPCNRSRVRVNSPKNNISKINHENPSSS